MIFVFFRSHLLYRFRLIFTKIENKQIGEINKQIGEINKQIGEINKQIGEINKQIKNSLFCGLSDVL